MATEQAKIKRRERAKAKRAAKRLAASPAKPKVSSSADVMDIRLDVFSEADCAFWICHGINCILSDYHEGTWTPLFDSIYPENGGRVPGYEETVQTIIDKYNVNQKSTDTWPQNAKAALAWAVQDRSIVYVYYQESIRRLSMAFGGDADVEKMARSPHNSEVWLLLSTMQQKVLDKNYKTPKVNRQTR